MTAAVGQVPGKLIDWAAGVIGIPSSVVAAQITDESGGNPEALSSTGAQGVAQFEPYTWSGLGCAGSPNDVNAAMRCYAKYMYQLVQQYHGNVRDALAAYNAGPDDLAAGYGYADSILSNAGQPSSATATGGTGDTTATLTSATGGSDCLTALFPHTSWCPMTKSEARALIGGLVLVGGGLVMAVGLALVAVFALNRAGVSQTIVNLSGAGRLAGGSGGSSPAPARQSRPYKPPPPGPCPPGQRLVMRGNTARCI